MTSDTLNIRGPIPLTAAGVQMGQVVSLMFVLCNKKVETYFSSFNYFLVLLQGRTQSALRRPPKS